MAQLPQSIDHSTLARLVESGAVRAATVIGQPAGWGVLIKCGAVDRPLAAQRGRMRTFRHLETVVGYLKKLGVSRFEVDAANYDPEHRNLRTRPDSAAALKHAHEAAIHDKWFREQVQVGLADLESGRVVTEEEHDANWAKRRAALVKRVPNAKA